VKKLALLVLIVLSCIWILPIFTMFITASKSSEQATSQPLPWQLPKPFSLGENASIAWNSGGLKNGFVNSLFYGVAGSLFAIFFASLAAYALVNLNIKMKFFWFIVIYSGTIFPFQMFLIPLFEMYQKINLYDTIGGLALFYIAVAIPFCLFVLHNYFTTIPREIAEAAKIDGASSFHIYARFYIPLSYPAIAVLFLFQFTWIWNDLLFGLVLSKSEQVRPIMPSLAGLMGIYSTINIASVLAGGIIASVPTLLLFVLLNRNFIYGLTLSTSRK